MEKRKRNEYERSNSDRGVGEEQRPSNHYGCLDEKPQQDGGRWQTISDTFLYDKYMDIAFTTNIDVSPLWIPVIPAPKVLRLVVYSSSCLPLNSIIQLNHEQLSIGRDRSFDKRLRLKDLQVSRFHAILYAERVENVIHEKLLDLDFAYEYKSEPVESECFIQVGQEFWIVDQGSSHGTFVAGQPCKLKHMDKIKIGTTHFYVHIHSSEEKCKECQAKSKIVDLIATGTKLPEAPQVEYIQPLSYAQEKRLLKEMFVGEPDAPRKSQAYTNRASERRRRDRNEEYVDEYSTAPIAHQKVAPNYGKGMTMLKMMGWKGQGLGKEQSGMTQPIQVDLKLNKLGIGALESKK